MDNSDLLEALLGLAKEAGLEVRLTSQVRDNEMPPMSGTCRVRDAVWVVLSASDPLELQLGVLANALRTHARALIESRYLPPAVRNRLS